MKKFLGLISMISLPLWAQVNLERPAPVLSLNGVELEYPFGSAFEFDANNFVRERNLSMSFSSVEALMQSISLPGLRSEQGDAQGRVRVWTLMRFTVTMGDRRISFERSLSDVFITKLAPIDWMTLLKAAPANAARTELSASYLLSENGVSLPNSVGRKALVTSVQVSSSPQSTLLNFPLAVQLSKLQVQTLNHKEWDERSREPFTNELYFKLVEFCGQASSLDPNETQLCEYLNSEILWSSVKLRLKVQDSRGLARSLTWQASAPISDCGMSTGTGRPWCIAWGQGKTPVQSMEEKGFFAYRAVVEGRAGSILASDFYHFVGRWEGEDSLIEVAVSRFRGLQFIAD